MDLSDLKIINSRAIDLTNINLMWMATLIDGRKTMQYAAGRPGKTKTVM